MNHISGYDIEETLDTPTNLYRGKREKDKSPVIIKSASLKNSKAVSLLEHEYEISQNVDPEWGIKAIALERDDDFIALVFEDFKGEDLDHYIKAGPPELTKFLNLAINIASCVSKMHEKGIIHKDIKPSSILVNSKTGEVKLIDFSVATLFRSEYIQVISNPSTIEGSLPYMSPEQTGRMNRVVDSRSDMYSLGITLYELITGRLPFSAKDPLEWVYSHIAQTPVSPNKISSVIPKMISDIIMKLMAKVAEERYQTAAGLKYDLEKCLTELKTKKEIKPFVLGEKDISGKFQVVQKLYGRENELAILLDSFERVAKTGTSEFILISGYSGIGKTALVNELHKPIVKKSGFFISGKFDQYKSGIPFYTIAEAFKGLIRNILFEPENKIIIWKQLLKDALGINGQIIIDLIPQVELIIGKQPSLATVSSLEGQIRFNSVLEKFIQVFATEEHPLTIFLDDLQWADSASLNLIKQLVTNPENRYTLLVGTYRDNEVSPTHPLLITIDEIKNQYQVINEITLHPLAEVNVKQLIADTLNCELNKVVPLSDLVYKKTGGNPFFIIQFLTTLYKEKLLQFNSNESKWEWEIKAIEDKGYTENVVDLMTEKIKQLNISAKNMLELGACIGNKFDKHILSAISSKEEKEVSALLNSSIEEGFLLSYKGNYEFLHDRVQQAAYSLLSDNEKSQTHCKIGKLLIDSTPKNELEENIFVIVNHLSHSPDCLSDLSTKLNVAHLNLRAGEKARASGAYQSAKSYFLSGIALLPEKSWKTEYELTFKLHLELSTCEYLLGNFDVAEKLFDNILSELQSPTDKAKVYNIRLELYQILGKFEEASILGLNALKMLGLPFPETDTDNAAYAELLQVQEQLKGIKIEELLNKISMTDPVYNAAMAILMNLYAPFYNSRPQLLGLLTFRMTNYSLKHGNAPSSPYAYLYYGILLGTGMGDYKQGQQFGEMALALNDKQEHRELSCKVLQTYGGLVHPWSNPIHTSTPYLTRSYLAGLETGDLIFSGFAIGVNIYLKIMSGQDLQTTYTEAKKYISFFKRSKDEMMLNAHRVFIQHCLNLMGRTKGTDSLTTKDYNEELVLKEMQEKQFAYSYNWYYLVKMQVLYHNGSYKEALEIANKIKDVIALVHFAQLSVPEFCFYYSLTISAAYPTFNDSEKTEYIVVLKAQQDKMKKWADNCPENFLHKYLLISAELKRILNDDQIETMTLFEMAIKSAQENKFIQNEALGYELASKYYQNKGFKVIAESYIKEAKSCYSRWGAKGKVNQIETNNPSLKEPLPELKQDSVGGLAVQHLDLHTIIKASQAISSPLEIGDLNESLIRIVMEQAGARKGVLLLEQNDQLTIASEAILNGEITVNTYDPLKVYKPDFIPEKIIQYVKRTKETVILDDASQNNVFKTDKYVITNHTKSVICLPIIKQAKLIGILYLENDLFAGAFTADKIDILEILASQAAISIENVSFLAKLKKSEMRLRLAMTQLPIVMWTTDSSLRFTSSQGSLLKKLGVEPNASVGKTLYDYFQTNDPNFLPIDSHLKVLKGESVKYESEVQGIIFESYVEPLKDPKGEVTGCIGMAIDITQRKQSDAISKKRELQLSSIFDTVADVIFVLEVEKEGKYRFHSVNNAFIKTTGIPENKIIGMRVNDLIPEPSLSLVLSKYKQAIEEKKIISWEETSDYPTGKLTGIVSIAPVIDESGNCLQLIGSVKDITERKISEEKIHLSEARFRRFAEINNEGVVIHDEGKIIEVNPAFAKMFGYEETEVAGMNIFQFANPGSVEKLRKNILEHVKYPFEIIGLRKDNSTFDAELHSRIIDYQEKQLAVVTIRDISTRKKTENKLRESEERFRLLAESTNIIPWESDARTFQFTYIGPQAESIFGYPAKEWYTTDFWPNHIHGDDREQALEYCLKTYKTKKNYEFEYRMVAANGDIVWLQDIVNVVSENDQPVLLRGFFINITNRKLAEENVKKLNTELEQAVVELKESESKLKEAQKIASLGSWEWDIKKNIVTWTDELYRIFGVKPQEFGADFESYLKFIHPDDLKKVSNAIQNALEKRSHFEFYHRTKRKDGIERIIHSNGKLICDENGQPLKMYGIAHDITEVKKAELEIKKLNSKLEQRVKERTAELEIANKDLESFTYSVTHDLKAPLRAIVNFSNILQKKHSGLFNEEARELFSEVQGNAKKMDLLINDLLEFSRLGKKEIKKTDLNINEIVKEVLVGIKNANPQYNAKTTLLPLQNSKADEGLIKIVFTNLLSNAFKYSSKKSEPRIEIGGYSEGNENIYYIKDNGVGFDMKYVNKLFLVFSRLHSDSEFEGTGIGLATVFKIIIKHYGRIWVEAKEGEGATFYFSLPKE